MGYIIKKTEIVPMLTAQEVADIMGIKRSAVYNLTYKKDCLRSYKIGGQVRFNRRDVEEYMRQSHQKRQPGRPKQVPQSNLITNVKFL